MTKAQGPTAGAHQDMGDAAWLVGHHRPDHRQFFRPAFGAEIRAGPPVPVGGIRCIAFDPMQQGMHGIECGLAFVLLRDLVRLIPLIAKAEISGLDQVQCFFQIRHARLPFDVPVHHPTSWPNDRLPPNAKR